MLSSQERQEYIVDQVNKNGSVRVSDVSRELSCSEVTIRNDIRRLDELGLLSRTHGGAKVCQDGLTISFEQGECFWHKEEKKRIAERAYEYINSRDSIIIDDSTSGYYLAKIIRRNTEKRMIVITNSILTAAELSSARHIELFVVSGHVIGTPPSALDNFTVNAYHQFNATKAFIGANGIDLRRGVASLGTPQRDVKKAIVEVAKELYVLVDHTKFEGGSLFNVCPMSAVTRVITDRQVQPGQLELARSLGIPMDVV
ncbi:MAG: DeoR/GlpR family DNA-binding transcription regulator [Clostridiales bacterium]|nr:DeoR/GlpR family DNA-binding transcription regulator [Clostridiales bacterium]